MSYPMAKRERPIVRLEAASVSGRVPPHDLDAEAAVLSAAMLDAAALDRAMSTLKPEHFYSEANGKVFSAMIALSEARMPVDAVSLRAYLHDKGHLASIGGAAYLAQLSDSTPAVANIATHALIVFEKWRVRHLVALCQHTAAAGYDDVGIAQSFIAQHEALVSDLAQSAHRSDMVLAGEALRGAFTALVAAHERGSRILGISTGFARFDAKTSGLNEGDLTIIAGRPGMGKSAFVGNLTVNVASDRVERDDHGRDVHAPGYGVVTFQLEMPKEQTSLRMACSESRVDMGRLRQAGLLPDDWRRLTEAANYISKLPIWIDDTPAISLSEIRSKVRRAQAEYNRPATATEPERKIGLVIVDYLQLMKGREGVSSREQEISEISRGLKQLAKELRVHVVALSQLNRSVETRSTKDKRPQLSDLRESGAIEQDADVIVFIYRDEYYNPETTNARGLAELIIAKQRNGPTGKVMARFTGPCMRFDDLAVGDYPQMEDE